MDLSTNVQFKHIRDAENTRETQVCTFFRQVEHGAIDHRSLVVEDNPTFLEGAPARRMSPLYQHTIETVVVENYGKVSISFDLRIQFLGAIAVTRVQSVYD